MRAAIVSNDAPVQEKLSEYLSRAGFGINAADTLGNLDDAVAPLSEDDLLVVDCVEIVDVASVAQLTKDAGCRSVGLIADQQASQMQQFLQAGLDDLLVRPVVEEQLLLKLRSLGFSPADG